MNQIPLLQQLVGLAGIRDGDTSRSLLAAIAAIAVYLLAAPRGRRSLARFPVALLGLGLVPLAAAALFPEEAEGAATATLGMRLCVLASLFQSIVLLAGVCVWERISRPASQILLDVLLWAAVVAAVAIILGEAGVSAGTLFTGSAVVTAAIGFALRDTLGNVFAGLAIQAERPFEPGDWIQYDANPAHVGRVVEINWRATRVITLDEATVVIPNAQLGLASIRNFTKPAAWSRRSLFVTTPYDVSPQRVQEIILDAIRGSFGVLADPPASVVTNAFTERGVEHWVRFFTLDFDKRDRVDGMARDRIWFALSRNGIEIPVATQLVRLTRLPSPTPEPPEAAVERRRASLDRVGLLRLLDEGQRQRLAVVATEQSFAADEPIVRQGDPGRSMFVVDEGRVSVVVRDAGGAALELAELGPGDFFGEMSLLTGAPRSATVTAVVETRLLVIDKDAFRPAIEAEPRLAEALRGFIESRATHRSRTLDRETPREEGQPDLLQRIRDFFAI